MSTVNPTTSGPLWETIPPAGTAPASSSPAASATGGDKNILGKDDFLQLLVTQLKNQDPMNPSDPQQMAAQLAQFSSVEQLININDTLKAQQATSQGMVTGLNANMAVGALGRTVLAKGDQVTVSSDGSGVVSFDLDSMAADAKLHVFDPSGAEVLTQDLGSLGSGSNGAAFKLRTGYGAGKYTYSIEAVDSDGKAVNATTLESGKVDGIRYTANGPVLVAGPMEIELGNVVEITDAN